MISQALTAYSLLVAAGIRAVAVLEVLFFVTFHIQNSPFEKTGFIS
jgi:hypothetical protein